MVVKPALELYLARALTGLLILITQAVEIVLVLVDMGWLSVSEYLCIVLFTHFCF